MGSAARLAAHQKSLPLNEEMSSGSCMLC